MPRSTRWPTAPGRSRVEADDLAGELRRYGDAVGRSAGAAGQGRGAAGAVRAAQAQARRHDRGGAGARRGVRRAPRRAGRRRGGARGRHGGARSRPCGAGRARGGARGGAGAGCGGPGGRGRRACSASWRWTARASRRAWPRARTTAPSGGDEVEFLIAPNPGVPAGPLRETASGGELSRVMLALMSIAAEARALRRSCSTRSTPGSAARPPARSATSCARWRREGR